VCHGGGAGQGSQRRDSPERCLHDGVVEAEGLTGVCLEESSLASTWGLGRRREPAQCTRGRPERFIDATTSVADGRWRPTALGICSGDPAWTRGSGEECSGPQ
jgi:hypothetical protein